MSKLKIEGIHPEGATLARVDGSAVRVGDEVTADNVITLALPAGAPGGSVTFPRGNGPWPRIIERVAVLAPAVEVDAAIAPSALTLSRKVTTSTAAAPPAVKVTG
jgi:hypothetical protein